jgi:hypothetical protein
MRMIQAVRTWAVTVENRLQKMYLAAEPEGLRLFVIARTIADEPELLKAAASMAISLGDAGLDLGVSVIPDGTPDELRAFLDPDAALLLSWR